MIRLESLPAFNPDLVVDSAQDAVSSYQLRRRAKFTELLREKEAAIKAIFFNKRLPGDVSDVELLQVMRLLQEQAILVMEREDKFLRMADAAYEDLSGGRSFRAVFRATPTGLLTAISDWDRRSNSSALQVRRSEYEANARGLCLDV